MEWQGYNLVVTATRRLLTKTTVLLLLLFSSICVTSGQDWNVTCPSRCSCTLQRLKDIPDLRQITTVDCTRSKLKTFPANLPQDTQALLMKDNAINRIPENALENLTDLMLIDLSYNSLSELGPPTLFANLTSLRVLNLVGNRLSSIQQGALSGLSQLEELLLSLNRISSVEKEAFLGLKKLRTLIMSHNTLTEIHLEWFAHLPSLQQLYLDYNQLRLLERNSFSGLTSLSKLSMSHNNLSTLSSDSFQGLGVLNQLDLSYNQLTSVPSLAFTVCRRLRLLSLDGNLIRMLGSGAFQKLSVGELSLSNMSTLLTVDIQSIVNMPQLHTLRIHSNKNLIFVHPQALQALPQLEHLYLHDNGILALSSDLVLSLPSLQLFSFYGNPLQCDCNANWLQSAVTNRTFYTVNATVMSTLPPVDHVTFQNPQSYICDGPSNLRGKSLYELPISAFTSSCGPTAVALFQSSYQKELGKSISFDCRAIGVPFPHIHWTLSNGKIVNNTSNFSRIRVSRTGTLTVGHIKAQDAGTYSCKAQNDVGYDKKSTILHVHSKNIQILGRGATNNFITVTWNGTESTIATSDYMILYHKQGSKEEYKRVHLRPYMRKYTISRLQPDTPYELCIAYEHSKELVKLNCVTIRTKSQLYMMRGIQTISKLTIVLALCLTSLGVFLICILTVIIRRYHRRKSYSDPGASTAAESSRLAGATGKSGRLGHRFGPPDPVNYNKVEQISNIPLDNLYNPPTTPLCTSTTSLISTQSNA